MKSTNIAEHLCKMHILFNLALTEGIVAMNPAHGVRARDFGVKLATRRQGFSSEQVPKIFDGESEAFEWIVRLLAHLTYAEPFSIEGAHPSPVNICRICRARD